MLKKIFQKGIKLILFSGIIGAVHVSGMTTVPPQESEDQSVQARIYNLYLIRKHEDGTFERNILILNQLYDPEIGAFPVIIDQPMPEVTEASFYAHSNMKNIPYIFANKIQLQDALAKGITDINIFIELKGGSVIYCPIKIFVKGEHKKAKENVNLPEHPHIFWRPCGSKLVLVAEGFDEGDGADAVLTAEDGTEFKLETRPCPEKYRADAEMFTELSRHTEEEITDAIRIAFSQFQDENAAPQPLNPNET